MIKKEIRVLGIDDAPFNKFKDKQVLVIAAFYRGGHFLDGVLSTKIFLIFPATDFPVNQYSPQLEDAPLFLPHYLERQRPYTAGEDRKMQRSLENTHLKMILLFLP